MEHIQYLLKEYSDIKIIGPHLQKRVGTEMTINGIETHSNQDYYEISIGRILHVQKIP